MDIELRIRMAAESILENESLRAGLDNDSGEIFLRWGMDCAKRIAAETAGVENDEEAEEIMYPRMKALRKLLNAARDLVNTPEIHLRMQALFGLLPLAASVYGSAYRAPDAGPMGAMIASGELPPGEALEKLRSLFEPVENIEQGEKKDDEEEEEQNE